MQLKQFGNLFFKLSGLFIIYSLLFKYTIGAVFGINESNISHGYSGFSLNWNIFFIIVLCFVILIKNSSFLTYLFYRKNYIVELNEKNQYRILKVIFTTFSVFRLLMLFFTHNEVSFWNKLFSTISITFFFLILFHKIIITFMINRINSYSKNQSNYIFIFSLIPILIYFYFFWEYKIGAGSLNIFEFIFRVIILLITLSSPLFFRLLLERDKPIKSSHFTFILFFWILFLYNLQEFLFKLPNYERDNMYLVKDLTFHVVMPLFFLSCHSIFAKIKSISILQFAFITFGMLSIFCSILKYLDGTLYARRLYLVTGILSLFLSTRTSLIYNKVENIKLKIKIRSVDSSLQNSSSFLYISLLFLTISKYFIILFDYRPSFTDLISFAVAIMQLVIIGLIVSKKNLKLDNADDYINITMTFFLVLIFCNNYLWYLNVPIFSNHSFFSFDTVCFIVLLLAILLSSYLTKLIKVLLPKSYFKDFQS